MKANHSAIRLREVTSRVAVGISLVFLLGVPVSAQYGGGMGGSTGGGTMGTGSAPSYGTPGYGNGKAIGIGIGAAAAAVGAVYLIRHHRGPVSGCVTATSDDRLTILDEKTGETYALRASDVDIKAGERVELKGKRFRDETGVESFEVRKARDLGACQ